MLRFFEKNLKTTPRVTIMKKVLIFLVFLSLPLLSIGQNTDTNGETIEITVKGKETVEPKKETTDSSKIKSELLDLNYKKSNDIISIKAYRKSLQIKVKTVKLC